MENKLMFCTDLQSWIFILLSFYAKFPVQFSYAHLDLMAYSNHDHELICYYTYLSSSVIFKAVKQIFKQ